MRDSSPGTPRPDTSNSGTVAANQDSPPPLLMANAPVAPPGSAEAASTPRVVGRFRIGDELARGGMGVVYRAHEPAAGRDVAVKVLRDEFRGDARMAARFVAEARITAQLQHPGIPPVFEVGVLPDGSPFLAMKLIRGSTLADLLRDRPDVSADRLRFVTVFEKVCEAVAYAHGMGVVHRDLKPGNVMVGAFGEVQVMDWGLAKAVVGDQGSEVGADTAAARGVALDPAARDATRAGAVLGTPAYMPPEQATGAVDRIDARSDVFSLGGILCAILTGQPPYTASSGESARQLAAAGDLGDAHVRLDARGAEPELVVLCKLCLSPEKADRPRDAGAVAKAVADLRAAADERARRAELDRARAELRAAEQRKRSLLRLALAGSVLLLAAGGGAVAWREERQATARKTEGLERRIEDERRASEKREREARNRDALLAVLERCESALRAGDVYTAALALPEVERRFGEGGAGDLAARVARSRTDLPMLQELARIDNLRWTPVGGKMREPAVIVARWEAAFAGFGIVPGTTPAAEAARRVTDSLVGDRLLAALDLWFGYSRSPALADVLKEADRDDFRNAVRAAVLAGDTARVRELIAQDAMFTQPSRFAAAVGNLDGIPTEQARALLERWLVTRPGDLAALMGLGATYPVNQPDGAHERSRWYQAAVAAHPRNEAAWNALGVARRDTGDAGGAAAAFNEAIGLDPTNAMAHTNLGAALSDQGEWDAAVAAFRTAITHDPRYASAHFSLGVALDRMGDADGAIAAYREALRHDPNDAPTHNNLGLALKARGDAGGAIAAFKEAARLDPSSARPHFALGNTLRGKGDRAGAVAAYREAVKRDPKHATAHYNLGLTLHERGDVDGAMAAYREAIKHNPGFAPAHSNLGIILKGKGDADGAIAAHREAIKHDPGYATAHYNLGVVLSERGDLDGAVAAYREAVRHNPKHTKAHTSLGLVLSRKGDADGAIAAHKEAIKHDPNYAPAHVNLAVVYLSQKKYPEAVACARVAVRADPRLSNAHAMLGLALQRAGDLVGARAALTEAVRLDPRWKPELAKLPPAPVAPPPRPVNR